MPNIGNGSFEKELDIRGIKYIKLNYRWWMIAENSSTIKNLLYKTLNSTLNTIAVGKLKKFCIQNNIDIIHTNSMVINIGGILSKKTNIKHIWHIREFGYEDHGLKFINDSKESLRFMDDNSNKVIAISNSILNKFKNNFSLDKIRLIYNGVEYIDSKKEYVDNKTNGINILLAGAIKESKGQGQAVSAINNLAKKGYDITLNLAGNEENGYGEYLRNLAKENSIEKNIKFLGFTNNLNSVRRGMDIELICSKKEAFGRVTVEAMMCGNAIIGANTGATKELIEPYLNGLLYEEGNVEDLSNKIEYLISNPKDRKSMGEIGREQVINKFTSKINANNIYNLYREIL